MAYRIEAILKTLRDLQGHSRAALLFKMWLCCAEVDMISTDIARRAVPVRLRSFLSIFMAKNLSLGWLKQTSSHLYTDGVGQVLAFGWQPSSLWVRVTWPI